MFSFLGLSLEVIQVVIAAEASIVCFILAALTLDDSAVGLTVTAPLFVIFSPILVPATIATVVLTSGFTAAGTLGALSVALIRDKMGAKGKNKKGSSSPSSQNLSEMPITGGYGGSFGGKPFSGTFGNKLADAITSPATAPLTGSGAAPSLAGGTAPPSADRTTPPAADGAAPTPTPTPAPASAPPAGKKPAAA